MAEPAARGVRRTRMRPALAFLIVALLATTLLPFGEQPAVASCAAPYVVHPDRLVLHPGATVEVEGAAFADGCQDNGTCTDTLGCTHCDYGPEPTPMRNIALTLRQGGRSWPLGTADAGGGRGDLGQVTWTVEVPSGVKAGRAMLVAGESGPVRVRIR